MISFMIMKDKTNQSARSKACPDVNASHLLEKSNFHITPEGILAINGGLKDKELNKSREDFCVEAIISKGEKGSILCMFRHTEASHT